MGAPAGLKSVTAELERDGIVVLRDLLEPAQLASMQAGFARMLKGLRWNNFPGYEQTERYRHMVEDVLLLDQGFVDLALHPVITRTLIDYIGPRFELVEAKGWLSLPTNRDFHGWHGDAWYDKNKVQELQREVKAALYLTDVRSGAFTYIKGTHGKMHPRMIGDEEVARYPASQIEKITGPAGTVILFDTSGIHRQAYPILEPRQAVFLNYHDPAVPLQQEDVEYYRYHPLVLNAAFLGDLSEEDRRILGFGNKLNYNPSFERKAAHRAFQRRMASMFRLKLRAAEFTGRVSGRLRRLVGRPA
jgi:hypothetical protein